MAAEIPADGQWHTVTLDLTKLYLYGDTKGFGTNGKVLNKVNDIELRFSDGTAVKGDKGTLYVDDFQFTPKTAPDGIFAAYSFGAVFRVLIKVFTALDHFFSA